MKLERFIFLLLIPFIFSSCSINGEETESSDNSNSSVDDDDYSFYIDEPGFVESILPASFIYNDKQYTRVVDYNAFESEINEFLGYFINVEDLEKWQNIDQDENIVYICEYENKIYHYDFNGLYSNRFVVYTTFNDNELIVGCYHDGRLMKPFLFAVNNEVLSDA